MRTAAWTESAWKDSVTPSRRSSAGHWQNRSACAGVRVCRVQVTGAAMCRHCACARSRTAVAAAAAMASRAAAGDSEVPLPKPSADLVST
ncbi:hypothetical protein D3C87_1857890 [compost metagenome]